MNFWIGIKNFAKIESAKINISNYTLLAGQNNSGKTFLMQLVQGMSRRIANLIDERVVDILTDKSDRRCEKYVISEDNILKFTDYINNRLRLEKENIVKEIFGREIPIEDLYVDTFLEENINYEIYLLNSDTYTKNHIQEIVGVDDSSSLDIIKVLPYDNRMSVLIKNNSVSQKRYPMMISVSALQTSANHIVNLIQMLVGFDSLFLPASRTGLFLLYRDFFANKADDTLTYRVMENQLVENKEKQGDLAQPVYEFLRFLQTYSENENAKREYVNELNFFENNLIEGHIKVNRQGLFSYDSKSNSAGDVPMYLASSMINEVVPIVLAITSRERYGRLIIDEIEASLHPEKQLEMVRFLNRLNNRGMGLIVSTHSDTFVNRMNNLYVLSHYAQGGNNNIVDSIIKKLGLEKEDLIDPKKMFVYEFVNQPNGKSIVKEIIGDRRTGYQFDLFTDSAMKIYDEALKLGEIMQND